MTILREEETKEGGSQKGDTLMEKISIRKAPLAVATQKLIPDFLIKI